MQVDVAVWKIVFKNVLGDQLADQPCEDYLPDERRIVYDRMNPSMQPVSLFPNMREFRITMRQYAIRHEFELGIDVTLTARYIGYCKVGDCPWRIYARMKRKDCLLLWYNILFYLF